jgi:hypothetical protein
LILIGAAWSGLLTGLVFAGCANFALIAGLLFPDDFSRVHQALGVGLAVGSYLGAQVRFAQTVRDRREQATAALRRQLLREAQEHLASGAATAALRTLQPLAHLAGRDLLVAYRLAQALTGAGDAREARAAWQQVRELDPHGLYREQVRENERRLSGREHTGQH